MDSTQHLSSKEKLLHAGKELFAKRGFDGVSVRDIAGQAGVQFGLIRYYFGDKLGLYRACVAAYGEARLESARRFLVDPASSDDFELKLKYSIEDAVRIQMQDPALTRIVLNEVESDHPLAEDVLGNTMIAMGKIHIGFFTKAKEIGLLRPDVDPKFLTHSLQGIINHYVRTDQIRSRHHGFSLKEERNKNHFVEQIIGLLLNGARASGGKKK